MGGAFIQGRALHLQNLSSIKSRASLEKRKSVLMLLYKILKIANIFGLGTKIG